MKILLLFLSSFALTTAAAQGVNPEPENPGSPLQVVQDFLTAYQKHDHERFTFLLHPDVLWIQPGDNKVSGVKRSKGELLQMGARLSELSARTLKLVDVKYFSPEGNTVPCILHWTATQPTGAVLNIRNIDLYTVENGKIVSVKVFSENVQQENDFWGK